MPVGDNRVGATFIINSYSKVDTLSKSVTIACQMIRA